MLTPAYLSGISAEVVDVYAQVEQEIANDIVKRVMKTGYVSDYSKWQMQKAREFGYFQQDVNDILRKAQITASKDVKHIMAQAAKDSLAFDDAIYRSVGLAPGALSKSPALQALVLQGTNNSLQLISNFTKTTSIESYSAYQAILDKTYIKILSGAYSPQNAIHAAIKELASNGIEKVAYQSGNGNVHYDNVEVAVRRAIITGVNQSISKLQLARADEMGCSLVETSWHMGARPSHSEWQGQVFSLDRSANSSYPDFYDSTGYGTGEGLCGWNCYHSFSPYFDGLSTRAWDSEAIDGGNRDSAKEYEEQQKQRYYERQVRASKREVATLNTAVVSSTSDAQREEFYHDFQLASVKLKRREAALKEFLDETGRSRERFREQTGGWNRSVSSKAVWANKKAKRNK